MAFLLPAGQDNGPGFLEVGYSDEGEVVINLPRDMTGHITFTPGQARNLAELLLRKANEINPLPETFRCNICGGLVEYDGTKPIHGCWGGKG